MHRLLLLFCMALMGFAPPAHAGLKAALDYAVRSDWRSAIPEAKRSGDPVLLKLVMWQYAMDADSGASFRDITRFIEENPGWPDQTKLQVRAEMALRDDESVPDSDIIDWFGDDMPITGIGKLALAEALRRGKLAKQDTLDDLVREAWKNGDFDEPKEKSILSKYGSVLRQSDHIARTDRLLWEDRVSAAKRMLNHLPDAERKLAKARISLIENSKLASVQLSLVPSSLKNDPGLVFDRMRYRARRDDDKGVREMLRLAPKDPPYASKWWKYREQQAREAIGEGDYSEAQKLLAHHGQTEGANMADALWLQGWIKCEFTDQPKSAYQDFTTLYDKVRYPVSRARAAYWAGRAAERTGDKAAAGKWYASASAHPTTYYGQLALLERGQSSLNLPSSPHASGANSEVVKAIRLALQAGQDALANRLLALMIEDNDSDGEIAQLAETGKAEGYTHVSVRAAKKAQQEGVVLIKTGYPLPSTPAAAPLERPLILAITRQESEFDPHAKSPSGALGMMQLLKGTAKETAKKNNMGYSPNRLYETDYNMTLGSMYLKRLVNSYDGSYVLAIAAYNAGPGNVRKWMQHFGTPENKLRNAINWIETIPFSETRNYVQRVLENLQVYRTLEGNGKLSLDKDLER